MRRVSVLCYRNGALMLSIGSAERRLTVDRRTRFRDGFSDVVNERFTVLMKPGGEDAVVMAHLRCDLATREVAAFVGGEAGVISRHMAGEHPVGVHGCGVYLLTLVQMGADAAGRWFHVMLADLARDRTEDIRTTADGTKAVWPYREAVDRVCDLIDRHENDLADALLQAQHRLVEELRAGNVPSAAPDDLPDARARALMSLAALDRLPRYEGRRPAAPDRRVRSLTRAERRRRERGIC